MSFTILATLLKILTAAKEGVLLTNQLASVIKCVEAEGTSLMNMSDDQLLEILSKQTLTPEELIQKGRDEVNG